VCREPVVRPTAVLPYIMSHEAIRLGGASDFVEVEVLERGTLEGCNEGDLRLGVSVCCENFSGSYNQVWIARDDWSSFLAGLGRLERERTGEAFLLAMDPDEFLVHLRSSRRGLLACRSCQESLRQP
jgi:hypothetical protein